MTTKTLKYKTAEFHNDTTNRTLQSMVQSALTKLKAASKRRNTVDAGSGTVRLINYHSPYKSMRVGELLDYTKGHVQPFTRIDEDAETLPLDALSPPDEQSEFVHSMFFFAIMRNHVIISQSMSLRVRQFEDYINWLLRESEIYDENQFVALIDQPPTNGISDAKGLELSAPVHFGKQLRGGDSETKINVQEDEVKNVRFFPKGSAWKALKEFLPPGLEIPEGFDLDEVAKNRELVVKLELSWKRPRKDDSTSLLDGIARQLRHVDDELDYVIQTPSGTITKDQVKLSKSVSIGNYPSGLPKREDLWHEMREWLQYLIQQNRVPSE